MPFRATRRIGINYLCGIAGIDELEQSDKKIEGVSRRAMHTHGFCVTPYILRRFNSVKV